MMWTRGGATPSCPAAFLPWQDAQFVGLLPELRPRREGLGHAHRRDRRSAARAVVPVAEVEISGNADSCGQGDRNGGTPQ